MEYQKEQNSRNDKYNRPVRIAVIGAGFMAEVLINQMERYYPEFEVAVIVNRTKGKAKALFEKYTNRPVSILTHAGQLDENIEKGVASVTDDFHLVGASNHIQAIVEMTGSLEYGARAALTAIEYKKHFINFNSELDATCGPILNVKAKEAGIIYSGGDGDQPGVTLNLYYYVKSLGMTPLVCGSNKGMLDRYRNPDTQREFAESWKLNASMATSFADGTKLSFEQCCIANATGMQVEQRGMRGERVDGHVDDYKHLYNVEDLKRMGGVVDYLVGVSPKPGIFIYATTDDPVIQKQLSYLKMGDGPLYSFYTPYHLCALEMPNSIVKVLKEHSPVFSPMGKPTVEVISIAKENLKAGQKLDGIGGYTTYGECENTITVEEEGFLPAGLAKGGVLKRAIQKDEPIRFEDVSFSEDSLVYELYLEQKRYFATASEEPDRKSA